MRSQPAPELFERAQRGDAAARDQLVRFFLPLAKRVARGSATRLVESEDLEQVASLALVLAIDRFDPSRGLAFSTYAVPTITGEIKRYFRDKTWSVRVPRSLQENALRVQKAATEFFAHNSRAATPRELADLMELSVEDVLESMEAGQALGAVSLDAPITDEEVGATTKLDGLGADDPAFDLVDEMVSIGPSLDELSPRDRLVLVLRFREDLTQSEIAARIGVSQMHVSRILRSALDRLRELNERDAESAFAVAIG